MSELLDVLRQEGATLSEAELPSDSETRAVLGALIKSLHRAGGEDLVNTLRDDVEPVEPVAEPEAAPVTSAPPVPAARDVPEPAPEHPGTDAELADYDQAVDRDPATIPADTTEPRP